MYMQRYARFLIYIILMPGLLHGMEHGTTLLHRILNADASSDVVQRCVDEHLDWVDKPDDQYWTPLHIAVLKKNVDCAKVLLDAGANVNASRLYRDEESVRTPLGLAVRFKDDTPQTIAMVRLLLERGAQELEPEARNQPLYKAIFTWNTPVVRIFLEAGRIPQTADAIHEAADSGDTESVGLLIQYGAPLDLNRVGLCTRNYNYYLGVLPILLRAVQPLSDAQKAIVLNNIDSNQVWNNAQKETMKAMAERNSASL